MAIFSVTDLHSDLAIALRPLFPSHQTNVVKAPAIKIDGLRGNSKYARPAHIKIQSNIEPAI